MDQLLAAPEDILRAVLIALCQDSRQQEKALSHFHNLQALRSEQLECDDTATADSIGSEASDPIPNGSDETSNGGSRINGVAPSKKRVASEIAICDICQEAFSYDDNPSDSCRYHTGSLEVNDDSSVWDDWEVWREGDPYAEENMETYPEGYIWDCCKKRGDKSGCARGSHSAQHKKPNSGRLSGREVITID
ncbi:hypothetical protein F4859DRAFT_419217 [Xylaria cf. heliscus]|nr:hypothetical protein F4859DRAFT_419217 [Xylaria cf. heliscus]